MGVTTGTIKPFQFNSLRPEIAKNLAQDLQRYSSPAD